MKILMFGQTGQVAHEVQRRTKGADLEALDRAAADFENPEACAARVMATGAGAVINAVAYTAVDRAEKDEDTAMCVNALAPGAIARAAAARGLPLVHISTDYVFDGAGDAAFMPDHPTAPLGAYGRTKLAGEQAVRAAGGVNAILRTSWVVSAHGGNFVKTMLRLGLERDHLRIVADQTGGPTCAADIADACISIAGQLITAPDKSGTYHFAGAPDISWADFAREIFVQAGITCTVEDIPSSAYPTPARRPQNSRLHCHSTHEAFGISRPDWRAGLQDILAELGACTS
jgi:dTDP-4-dehydrorhamnose reductase